jgi:hypothetical protein
MTREQAEARCAELNADPDRDRQWFPRQAGPDEWEIVSMALPEGARRGPLKEAVESRPRPESPPDPRPSVFRNVPPYGAG